MAQNREDANGSSLWCGSLLLVFSLVVGPRLSSPVSVTLGSGYNLQYTSSMSTRMMARSSVWRRSLMANNKPSCCFSTLPEQEKPIKTPSRAAAYVDLAKGKLSALVVTTKLLLPSIHLGNRIDGYQRKLKNGRMMSV